MKEKLSISDMAKIHGITRQTLIYYDRIGLFKPDLVTENGYRYYSWQQIPRLREICFLQRAGVPLKEIEKHFHNRCPESEIQLLVQQKETLERQIGELNKTREAIVTRIRSYQAAIDAIRMQKFTPFLAKFGPRKAAFKPYFTPITRENLHLTVMALCQELDVETFIPGGNFGSILKWEALRTDEPLAGAGSCVFLPTWADTDLPTVDIPAGDYACLFTTHMPYEPREARDLLDWVESQGLKPAGDVIDVCLLDTTFYTEKHTKDFCMIQIPVKK